MGVNATGCAATPRLVPDDDTGGGAEPPGTALRVPTMADSLPTASERLWRTGLGRGAAGPLAFRDSVIAAMALDRNLSVIDGRSGDRRWRKRLSAPGSTGPLLAGDRIFVATGGVEGRVYGFSLAGEKRWEHRLGFVQGPLATVDSLVVVATERGDVTALDLRTGEPRWYRRIASATRGGILTHRGDLLVATDDSLFRLSARDGSMAGKGVLPGTPVAPLARQGDTVVVATGNGHVAALDATDLGPVWSVDVNGPVFGTPVIARDSAFVVTLRGDLWRIPLANPAEAVAVPLGTAVRAPAAPIANGVLIGTLGGEILLVRGDSVVALGRVEGPIEQAIVMLDDVLYVVDGRGRLAAWR